MAPRYVEVAKKKQSEREAAIPKEYMLDPSMLGDEVIDVSNLASTCGLLSSKEVEIINTPAVQLLQGLTSGKLKSFDVTLSFIKASTIAHQAVNPLTEVFFDKGLQRAKEIDEEFAKTGKPVGKLHGLPLSIKDCFNIKGFDSTIGFAKNAFNPASGQSVLVDILQEEGAVLYCKTNIPHAMMRADSVNNTFGRTVNPYNRQLGAGGSSGGEGALLAMGGAPLGVGTDIGGSIRMPSAFNNLFGLKPSSGRIPLYGGATGMPGQEAVPSIAGPMGKNLEDLDLFCKVVIGAKPWLRDPKMLPIPWNDKVEIPERLVIGLIEQDNICTPTPPVQHAMKTLVAALKAAGHHIVPFNNPTPQEMVSDFAYDLYTCGGDEGLEAAFSAMDEEWPDEMKWMRGTKKLTVPEMWQLQAKRTSWLKEVLDKWAATAKQNPTGRPIDCILSPSSVFSAPPQDKHAHLLYTSTWNIADWSAGVFPVLRVTKENAQLPASFTPKNDIEKQIYADYKPEQVIGAPVGLQVICQKYEDEKVLKILGVMDKVIKANSKAFGN